MLTLRLCVSYLSCGLVVLTLTHFISLCASVFVKFGVKTGNHDHPPQCIVGKCVAWNLAHVAKAADMK